MSVLISLRERDKDESSRGDEPPPRGLAVVEGGVVRDRCREGLPPPSTIGLRRGGKDVGTWPGAKRMDHENKRIRNTHTHTRARILYNNTIGLAAQYTHTIIMTGHPSSCRVTSQAHYVPL